MLMNTRHATGRPAFTLIELLVVIFLITFLAGMTVLIGPALILSESSSRGAQLLQGNLFVAKQQALRDRAPYGIRLLKDADGQVRSFQFIQQPSDFTGGDVTVAPKQATFTGVDLTGGLQDPTLWPVQINDFFQFNGGTPVRIGKVNGPNDTPPNSISIPSNIQAGGPSGSYRIFRGPRPAAGEDTFLLPDNVIVDMGNSGSGCPGSSPLPSGAINYDILFAPAGAVLGPLGSSGKIILWVRDTTQNWQTTTSQSLIVVYTRTGLIASYPVDTGSGNWYSYTQDPATAGGL